MRFSLAHVPSANMGGGVNDLHWSQPPVGDHDVLSLLLEVTHGVHLYIKPMGNLVFKMPTEAKMSNRGGV